MANRPASANTAALKILAVDDEGALRSLVRRVLDDPRFELVVASDGAEALAAVPDAQAIDLLITDEMMPVMKGHELARRLRLQNLDLRVLYLTGYSDALFESKERLWDREAYLDKPFTQKALIEAIALLMVGKVSF